MKNRVISKWIIVWLFGLWVFCGAAVAVEVLEPGYAVETYASYSDAGIQRSPWDMVFVPDGNLYATHLTDGSIRRVTPDGIASEFVAGISGAAGIVWAGGTDYGDYLYAAATSVGVVRVDLDGHTSSFASRGCAGTLGLDRTGNYGGYMYTTTGCVDHTYRVYPDGSVTMFSSWPTHINGGGPHNITFDNVGNYGGWFYVASAFVESQAQVSGLFIMDPCGNAGRFAPDVVVAHNLDFDPTGDFGWDMFVIGRSSYDNPESLWRVSPDGTATAFATLQGVAPRGMAFGPDGALYIGEYISEIQQVIISRITPYITFEVAVDIKPGSCPNPLNPASRGLLPVAVLGAEDFDVSSIDAASIRLEGIAPIRSHYEDVATPAPDGNECDCSSEGPDGRLDLTLKFKTQQVVEELVNLLGEVASGDELVLTLTATLADGTLVEGSDCVVVVGKVPEAIAARKSDITQDGIVNIFDFAAMARHWLKPAAP